MIFVEAPQSLAELARDRREVPAPLLVNMVAGGLTPELTTERLAQLGTGSPSIRCRARRRAVAMLNSLAALGGFRRHRAAADRPAGFFELLGLREWPPSRALPGRRRRSPGMGMTMIEKIWPGSAGLAEVHTGQTVVCDVDMTVLIDLQFATGWIQPLRINDPDKVAVIMDHAVPAPTVQDAEGGPRARTFAATSRISRFYDVGRHGICHQVIAENGLARPGEILACTDSHTCAGGAYNTAARGLGPPRCSRSCAPARPGSPSRPRSGTS